MASSPSPNTPSQHRDRCLKQLKTLNSELDRWNSTVKSGAGLLESIGERKRQQLERRESEDSGHSAKSNEDTLELQDLCEELSCACGRLAKVCADLEKAAEKLGGLANLDHGCDKVATAARVIARCHKEQCDMNRAVAENVAKSGSEDVLLLHLAVWMHQPALESHCDVAKATVDHVLEDITF